jgi:hypothetical protein
MMKGWPTPRPSLVRVIGFGGFPKPRHIGSDPVQGAPDIPVDPVVVSDDAQADDGR